MIARRAALAQLGIAATAALTGCGFVGPWYPKYRFRLTVMIETPGGPRTGSSVYEVKTSRTGEWLPASPNQMGFAVRGQSVIVDLPGAALFTTLDPGWLGSVMINASEYHHRQTRSPSGLIEPAEIRAIAGDPVQLVLPRRFSDDDWNTGYPKMVRFRNERDPASVEWVNPDNVSASFGAGIRLNGLTVQITQDPVGLGLSQRLAWLSEYARSGKRLNGSTSIAIADNLANNNLGAGAFLSDD
jgi:hypothetical protein